MFGRNSKASILSSVSFASSLSNNQQGHPTFFQLCSYVSKVTGNKGGPVCLLYNKKKSQSCPFVNFDSKSICLKHRVSRCRSSERLRTGRYIRQDETSTGWELPPPANTGRRTFVNADVNKCALSTPNIKAIASSNRRLKQNRE